jgi:ribosomal protein S18 acetylase RimI-like enzyme
MGSVKQIVEVEVRSLKAADIGSIIDIDEKLAGGERTASQAELITADIESGENLSYVAVAEGKVVGFLIARHLNLGEPVTSTAAIQYIGVDPDYSRHGIAAKLVNALISRSRIEGIKAIRAIISDRDNKLEGFFKHAGFTPSRLKVFGKNI